jgi:hypothetical protein
MRRAFTITTCALALGLAGTALVAQDPPAQPAAPPKQPTLAFSSPAGLMFNQVKPDQTAAFEEGMAKIKEALGKSAAKDEKRKAQAAGWKVYKAKEPMGVNALYIFVMDPVVEGADYGIFQILLEGFGDAPAREIYAKLAAAYADKGVNQLNLTPLQNFGGGN